MKIAVITIHAIPNFGSVFQAMALNRFLISKGYDCKIIDYNPTYFEKCSFKTRMGQLLNLRAFAIRRKKYANFIQNNMKLTQKSYSTETQLEKECPEADVYLSGGDQLWNEFYPCGNDDAFKLVFAHGRKMAYGTSMGKNSFTQESLQTLKEKTEEFEAFGIRESSGAQLLQTAGFPNVRQVMDPVFLLPISEYLKFIKPVAIKEKYLFVYLVQKSPLLEKSVNYIAKELGLKVVLYAGFSPKCRYDYFLKDIGPEENLSYLYHADFVLSASFHACAFSSYFSKQFAVLLPGENTNARIEDFMELTEQTSNIIKYESDLTAKILSQKDKKLVEEKIEEWTVASKAFLLQTIECDC